MITGKKIKMKIKKTKKDKEVILKTVCVSLMENIISFHIFLTVLFSRGVGFTGYKLGIVFNVAVVPPEKGKCILLASFVKCVVLDCSGMSR